MCRPSDNIPIQRSSVDDMQMTLLNNHSSDTKDTVRATDVSRRQPVNFKSNNNRGSIKSSHYNKKKMNNSSNTDKQKLKNKGKKRVHPARKKKLQKNMKNEQRQLKELVLDDITVSTCDETASMSSAASCAGDSMPSLGSDVVITMKESPKKKKPSKKQQQVKNKNKNKKKNLKKKKTSKSKSSQAVGPVQLCMTEEESRFVALDCEMVGIGEGGTQSALARVSLVDYYGHVILDTFVTIEEEITDYRTSVSGITPELLSASYSISIESCRVLVSSLIEDKIIIGHALKNDLRAIGISHPWHAVRDTIKYDPFLKECNGVMLPRRLKDLALDKLGKHIQIEGFAHCPIVDAQTALELYKLVSNKWEKVIEYKVKKTREIEEVDSRISCL